VVTTANQLAYAYNLTSSQILQRSAIVVPSVVGMIFEPTIENERYRAMVNRFDLANLSLVTRNRAIFIRFSQLIACLFYQRYFRRGHVGIITINVLQQALTRMR
jgi:hypothetical protein